MQGPAWQSSSMQLLLSAGADQDVNKQDHEGVGML